MTTLIISKTCSCCNETKPISHFGKAPGYRDGHRCQCSQCRGERYRQKYPERVCESRQRHWRQMTQQHRYDIALRRNHGLTPAEYESILLTQDGKCALCGRASIQLKKRLCVDHCHTTGVIRGLLCYRCNNALCKLGDTEERIIEVFQYLQRAKAAPYGYSKKHVSS